MVTTSTLVSSDDSLLDRTSIPVHSSSVIQNSYKCQSLEIPAPIWLSGTPLQAPVHSSYSPTTVSSTQHRVEFSRLRGVAPRLWKTNRHWLAFDIDSLGKFKIDPGYPWARRSHHWIKLWFENKVSGAFVLAIHRATLNYSLYVAASRIEWR